MPWSPGNSTSKTADADFVTAWQHVANLVHSEGQADGITAQTVWNPSTSEWSPVDIKTLYPGNQYVDIEGIDIYSSIYGGTSSTNRQNWWQNDNGGSGWSMQKAIDFAKQTGKPLELCETGAGSTAGAYGPSDDPAFVNWLSGALQQATAQGVKIQDIGIWDANMSNANLNWTNGSKPLEAAAWSNDFGAGSGIATGTGPDAAGSGSGSSTGATHTLTLKVSEDAWKGNAQFTITVDGQQIGGTQTATASHAARQDQAFNVAGSFQVGRHSVSVDFLNDASGGTAATDRNLYVDGAAIDGTTISGASLQEYSGGAQTMVFIVGSGSSTTGAGTGTDAQSGGPVLNAVTVNQPASLAAGLRTITGAETDPTQSVWLDWHTNGAPAASDSGWVQAKVSADGTFAAAVAVDHTGVLGALYEYAGTGAVTQAWTGTPH